MDDPLDKVRTDQVALLKQDGRKLEKIKALVKGNIIKVGDIELPVEEGDTFIRETPRGVLEEYLVLDSGYRGAFHGLPARYESKVRKKTSIREAPPSPIVYNISGNTFSDNSRINLRSYDLSTNIIDVNAAELLTELSKSIESNIEDDEKRPQLLAQVAAMEKAQGSSAFKERYKEFIAMAADHMTVLSPFLPGLSQLL